MSRSCLGVDSSASRSRKFAVPTPSGSPRIPATPSLHKGGPCISVFRTVQLELRLYSSTVKSYKLQGNKMTASVPVFGYCDQVRGSVSLNPRLCSSPGRITLSFEGAFLLSQPNTDRRLGNNNQKHFFFTSTQIFPTLEPQSASGPKSIREAFANSVRPKGSENKQGSSDLTRTPRSFPFKFEIPRPIWHGQEMPPTFRVSSIIRNDDYGNTHSEQAEVSYTITALWEAYDDSDSALLEAPIIFRHDTVFHSLCTTLLNSKSWLELPLRMERTSMPFHCAIAVPNPLSCSRSSSIPFFVVFTTQPRSRALSLEIAADATITVSLLRVVTINISQPYTVTSGPAPTTHAVELPFRPSSSLSHDKSSTIPMSTTSRLIRRVVNSASPALIRCHNDPKRPAAALGPAVSETRTLQTDICIGFPKRPKYCGNDQGPSVAFHGSLPDGLHKGKVELSTSMLPSIDWAGLNVKYYLEVSVLFGQDELRARVPVQLF